jgi:hypothetical protein
MPRYNLNHQDINTIVNGLDYLAINAHSAGEHNRITNLKNRILSKLNSLDPIDDDELDPWEAFSDNVLKDNK